MRLDSIERLLWLASTCGNVTVLSVLLSKHRHRTLRFFTLFVLCSLLRTAVLYAVRYKGSKHAYFAAYWAAAIVVDVLLQAGVLYEIALIIFRQSGKWPRDAKQSLSMLLLTGLTLAVILTACLTSVAPHIIEAIVIKGSFFSAMLMAELCSGMMVLSVRSGLPWTGYVSHIALGFGFYSLVVVVIEAAHNIFGKAYGTELDFVLFNVRATAYLATQAYWTFSLARNRPPSSKRSLDASRLAHSWASLLSRGSSEST